MTTAQPPPNARMRLACDATSSLRSAESSHQPLRWQSQATAASHGSGERSVSNTIRPFYRFEPEAASGVIGSLQHGYRSLKTISWAPSHSIFLPRSRRFSFPSTIVAKWFPASAPALLANAT